MLYDVLFVGVLLIQAIYFLSFCVDMYLFSLPINLVDMNEVKYLREYPKIVLFYPVLKELEKTMDTTFAALAKIEYPVDRYKVIAIPNANDIETVASLRRLQRKYSFLDMIEVPATTDPRWEVVWANWDSCEKAYWWHEGKRAFDCNLPPKKTRQLIYAFYRTVADSDGREDFLVNYIDADSAPPKDHFLAAAVGIKHYDVLQSQNVAGNLLENMATTFNAMDHMAWDGYKYPHLSSNGFNPYWVLGKGLFFKASDLLELGGFHPWITIEDPEVGMRFWKNGRKLGIIEGSLIEEVPNTFKKSIIQRKRWVAGFFQALNEPLNRMGFTFTEKLRAWLIFMPCLSLAFNCIGIPVGMLQAYLLYKDHYPLPMWTIWLALTNFGLLAVSLLFLYRNTWRRTRLVLNNFWKRVYFMLRVNPLFLMGWWLFWSVPLAIGFNMFRKDLGLTWERTEKLDTNRELVHRKLLKGSLGYTEQKGV
jgi:glycosyltransferase XagB